MRLLVRGTSVRPRPRSKPARMMSKYIKKPPRASGKNMYPGSVVRNRRSSRRLPSITKSAVTGQAQMAVPRMASSARRRTARASARERATAGTRLVASENVRAVGKKMRGNAMPMSWPK